MLKFSRPKITTNGVVVQKVHILFKIHPVVQDYVDEIHKLMNRTKNSAFDDIRDVWVYSNGVTIGYVKLQKNRQMEYYFNGNKNIWGARVAKCESMVCGGEHLYRIWIKNKPNYHMVRPKNLPYMFTRVLNKSQGANL